MHAADGVVRALFGPDGIRDPYPFYAELHRLGQACEISPGVGGGSDRAVAHGYAAVDTVMRNPLFRTPDANMIARRWPNWQEHPMMTSLVESLLYNNGADHARMRGLFQPIFKPSKVAALAPAITRYVDRLLDRMAELGTGGAPVDFMAEFAYSVPSGVIAALMGIPDEDLAWFRPRVHRMAAHLDARGRSAEKLRAADQAVLELREYYAKLVARRRAEPGDDLVSELAMAVDTGAHDVSESELVGNLLQLFNGGFVTTINLLGNGLVLLLERPELMAALRSDPDLLDGCIEEVLRYEAPSQFVNRWAAEDTEVAGIPVERGASVLVIFGAANRDPLRFPDPDRFDPHRPAGQTMSFGAGPHFCLGSRLARLEARLAFQRLFERFPALALGDGAVREELLYLRGYRTLPVTLGRT